MTEKESKMSDRAAVFLGEALDRTVKSYEDYTQKVIEDKNFKTHHDACKAALSHIEMLLKLTKMSETPPADHDSALKKERLRVLMENARAELKG